MKTVLYTNVLLAFSILIFLWLGGSFFLILFYSGLYLTYLKTTEIKNFDLMLGISALAPLVFYKIEFGREESLSGSWLESQDIPLAISFISLQFCLFVARERKAGTKINFKFTEILFAVNFIPQLIAGPVVPIREFLERNAFLVSGIRQRFFYPLGFVGFALFLKLFLAENLLMLIDFGSNNLEYLTNIEAFFVLVGFYFFIYFDFLSYSILAVSLSSFFGYRMLWNFIAPYQACSITEFWRRWHISLHICFKEAIYTPLSGFVPSVCAVIVVFLISGLWHGVGLGFVLWGVWHAFGVCAYRFYRSLIGIAFPKVLGWLCTQAFVLVGWSFFWLNNLRDLSIFYEQLLTAELIFPVSFRFHFPWLMGLDVSFLGSPIGLGLNLGIFLVFCIGFTICFDRMLLRQVGKQGPTARYCGSGFDAWGFPDNVPNGVILVGISLGLFGFLASSGGFIRYVYFNF